MTDCYFMDLLDEAGNAVADGAHLPCDVAEGRWASVRPMFKVITTVYAARLTRSSDGASDTQTTVYERSGLPAYVTAHDNITFVWDLERFPLKVSA